MKKPPVPGEASGRRPRLNPVQPSPRRPTLAAFSAWVEAEVAGIPEQFKGGVRNFFVDHRVLRHSSKVPGLFILGHFHTDKAHLGTSITLYYGSFRRVFRFSSEADWRREIAATIMHELLHHWEHRSGYDALGDEDRRNIQAWKSARGLRSSNLGTDLWEALLFLLVVFGLLLLASVWVSR